MILSKFDYCAPNSISEVCSLLEKSEGKAAVMAGGTDLIVQMKQQTQTPELVVSIKRIPELQHMDYDDSEGLRIGSMVTLQTLARSAVVRDKFPILAEAAGMVGAAQHQFMGTVGGNLCLNTRCLYYNRSPRQRRSGAPCHKLGGSTCHAVRRGRKCYAVYSADVGSTLFALGARAVVSNSHGQKVLALDDFFTGNSINPNTLQKEEIVKEIIVPPRRPGFARHYKLRPREAIDFPQVGVTFVAFPEDQEYRVVVSAVAAQPLRFKKLETMLRQERLSQEMVTDFTARLVSKIRPVANVFGPPAFRRRMIGILTERAFEEMGVAA